MALAPVTTTARLAQSVERQALNLMVVGSIPTVGVFAVACCFVPLQAKRS